MIYTTHAIERLHSQVRKAIRNQGHSPNDEAATKLIWLALRHIEAKWKCPPIYWHAAKAQLAIQFEERFILPGFDFALDPLRGFFLVIAAGVYAVSAPSLLRDVRRRPRIRAGLVLGVTVVLFAAMLTVLLAAGVTSLLFAWEIMSLALATLVFLGRGERIEVRAGLTTLAFSEAGALAALAGLLVLAGSAGTFSLAGIAAAASQLPTGVRGPDSC